MLKKFKVIVLAFILVFSSYSNLLADEIIFLNGDKITGNILFFNGETFEVETSFGKIQIPKSEILKIEFNNKFYTNLSSKLNIVTPDDLLSYIQNSRLIFYIDGEKINANNFSNQIRIHWAMKMSHIKELNEFCEKLLFYSLQTGNDNFVEISKGKKIKVSEWIESILKSSKRNIKLINEVKKTNISDTSEINFKRNFNKNKK